jgi:hypothetical protein
MEYSTSYNLWNLRKAKVVNKNLLSSTKNQMLNLHKGNKVHEYKFSQWKGAMTVRYNIEALFVAF